MKKCNARWYDKFYIKKKEPTLSPWNKKIFEVIRKITHSSKNVRLLDIGCGTGGLLLSLARNRVIAPENLYGIDWSEIAINKIRLKKRIPPNNLNVGDVEKDGLRKFVSEYFDIIVMAEVIEHLKNPDRVLGEVYRILKPNRYLIISFPNYLNVPWLFLRLLAEKLNKPQWIVLQPVDHIFTSFQVKKMIECKGFKLIKIHGEVYFPPILYKYESECFSRFLDKCNLSMFAFHPVMTFVKTF